MGKIEDKGWEKFVTGVGLITSNGPHGHNIMAAEWTRQVSYNPFLISVHVSAKHATTDNIKKTKVFGVSLCTDKQNIISSLSGNYKGRMHNKIAALKKLGFKFYKAKKINVMMVQNSALNAECKVIKTITLGDHIMFVGKVIAGKVGKDTPLAYNHGLYYYLNKNIPKPSDASRAKMKAVMERHRKAL
jgi:flavin reductase (DIM6/NTAB) family NADH-FMN oxidoreductase RutF